MSTDSSEDSDANDLAQAVGPSKRKRKSRTKNKKVNAKSKKGVEVNWTTETKPVNLEHDFKQEKVGVPHDLPHNASPFDYFSLFLPESFFEKMREETNIYAAAKQAEKGVSDKHWNNVTVKKIRLFICIQYMFGIHHMPDTTMYWSSDPLLRVPAIADVM